MSEVGEREEKAPSLHRRILAELEARIVSGEWPPGYRIPFEHELTTQFGCSRMTVNKALTQMVSAGLIERRRKAGSFVSQPRSEAAILEIHGIEAEVLALGQPWRFELLHRRERHVSAREPWLAPLRQGTAILDLACCHFAGPRPFCLEERVISLEAVPQAGDESFDSIAPGTWLVSHVPWTVAEHHIRAVAARGKTATALGLAAGTACLVVERRTWKADEPVTFVRFTYPGESHELVARFAPAQTGAKRATNSCDSPG